MLHKIAYLLVIIGGINWLIDGIFNWDIGDLFGDPGNAASRIIYILVGLAAIYELATHRSACKLCETKPKDKPTQPMPPTGGGAV